MNKAENLSKQQREKLLGILKVRFEENANRHAGLEWSAVEKRLTDNPAKLWTLHQMEITGGEPDVFRRDARTGEYIFVDCSTETPKERRSLCYDDDALKSRKENKPKGSALAMAASMGLELMDQQEYRELQRLGEFDTKTSSWIATPSNIRKLGGALFCDRRYDTVFVYHNGAESYYAARGFRGIVRV